MKAFTAEEIEKIRKRAKSEPELVSSLYKSCADIKKKLYVPKRAIATWWHYYACPYHGCTLVHNYYDSEHFTCPVCNETFTGEPYAGGWWAGTCDMIAEQAYCAALVYLISEEEEYFELAKKVLVEYAKYYKDYEVHGNIPYNNPGKMMAQVLDDACAVFTYAQCYDIIKDRLSAEEIRHIEEGLFLPAAEHCKKYLTPQLHNHEVCIGCTIGAIGIVTDNDELADYAINHKYGLKYQLDHGLLDDGVWFEVSMGYHLYVLNHLMSYEQIAKHTDFALMKDEKYRDLIYKMALVPLYLSDKNGCIVKVNDGGGNLSSQENTYEYLNLVFGTDEMHTIVNHIRKKKKKKNIFRLFYEGEIPKICKDIPAENYISECGSNIAKIIDGDRLLFFKASPYGGEHDHYDRLALNLGFKGIPVSEDFGTTPYGSPLHYGYFKNTATHNTVCINGENMAPCATRVIKYDTEKSESGYMLLDAETSAPEGFVMPDSFTIKQWSDEAYSGVGMRRRIYRFEKYFVDVFDVSSDNTLDKDWIWHTLGDAELPKEAKERSGFKTEMGPRSYMHSIFSYTGAGIYKTHYDCGDVALDIYSLIDGKEMILSKGPSNIPGREASYLHLRSCEKNVRYINVFEVYEKGCSVIERVDIEDGESGFKITVTEKGGKVNTVTAR